MATQSTRSHTRLRPPRQSPELHFLGNYASLQDTMEALVQGAVLIGPCNARYDTYIWQENGTSLVVFVERYDGENSTRTYHQFNEMALSDIALKLAFQRHYHRKRTE